MARSWAAATTKTNWMITWMNNAHCRTHDLRPAFLFSRTFDDNRVIARPLGRGNLLVPSNKLHSRNSPGTGRLPRRLRLLAMTVVVVTYPHARLSPIGIPFRAKRGRISVLFWVLRSFSWVQVSLLPWVLPLPPAFCPWGAAWAAERWAYPLWEARPGSSIWGRSRSDPPGGP